MTASWLAMGGAMLPWPIDAAPDPVVKQGSFTKNTTTGSQLVTGLGFRPKAVVFYWTLQTAAGTQGGTGTDMGAMDGQGFATGADSERAMSFWDEDQAAATSTDTGKATYDNASIVMQGDDGALRGVADLTSLDSDGFTLNWSTADSSAYIINYYALSETIVTDATVNTFSLTTGTGNLSVTNAGFQADFVMMMTAGTTAHGVNSAEGTYSTGVATGSSGQWSVGGRAVDNVDISDTCEYQRTNAVIAYLGTTANCATTTEDALADFTQFTSTGFDINKSNAPAAAMDVFYLALKGPLFKVGSFNKPTAAGSQATTGVGFQPHGVFFATGARTGGTGITASSNLSLGAASAIGTEGAAAKSSVDNNDASTPGRRTSTSKVISTIEGNAETLTGEADLTSFDSDGFTLDWTTADATADQYLYWAVGVTPPSYTQSAYRWYSNADGVQPGSALASESTTASVGAADPVRLRAQLGVSDGPLIGNAQDFNLQFATSTSGPWTDVGDTGAEAWCNDTTGITCTTSWGARRQITMNNSASSENLSDFPLLVKLNSSRIDYSKTQNSGQDIRFVDASDPNTVLPHEIETWNESGDSYVWVKVPQVDSGSTTDYIWMYYDNAAASDGQDSANAWNSNYRAVWHMDESGSTLSDSTANGNTGTKSLSNAPTATSARIGNGQSFNGSGDVNASDSTSLDLSGTMTTSGWINASALGGWRTILCKDQSFEPNYCQQAVDGVVDFSFGDGGGGWDESFSNTTLSSSTWYYLVSTYDDTANQVKIYLNGSLDSTTSQTGSLITNNDALTIGSSAAGEYWNGLMDELRISGSVRSGEWIEADYINQTDAMNTFGSEEAQGGGGAVWDFYDNTTPSDGAAISSTLLTGSDVAETYQESNPTPVNPNAVVMGQQGEWDFALDPGGASVGTTYYFRMVTSGGTALSSYSVYPEVAVVSNTAPNSPSSPAQKTVGDVTISTGDWHNQDSVKFTASASDADNPDILQLCVEKDLVGVAFSDTEDSCGTGVAYSGSPVSTSVTISGLADGTYHWQTRIKDAAGGYSSWVSFGGNAESAMDFGIDVTAPTGGTVYDGISPGVDATFNDGSLSNLSANWANFDAGSSGLARYEYSVGTSAAATDIKGWTDNSTSTSVTSTGLTLQTSQTYYVNVRAVDNAGNTGDTVSSNGQFILPTLSFGVSPDSIVFSNLNAGNSYTDSAATTLTTSTNAYGGYVVRAAATDFLRSGDFTIPDFTGGTYISPDSWQSGDTGFGYTSSDDSIQGSNIFQSGTCPGGSALASPGCFAPFSQTKPGDIVADHDANVAGTAISNEQFTVTYRVTVPSDQEAGQGYTNAIVYSVTPRY